MKKKKSKLKLFSHAKDGEYSLNQKAPVFEDKRKKKEKHKKKEIDYF